MTIRRRILLGCAALTLLTAFMGSYARETQRNLGAVTMRLYDDSFQAMSYLRSAQVGLTRAEAELRKVPPDADLPEDLAARRALADVLPDIAENLAVARNRTSSEQARRSVAHLAVTLDGLAGAAPQAARKDLLATLVDAGVEFDNAVEFYAAEGFQHRQEANHMVEGTVARTWAATAVSVLVGLIITAWLAHSIVPALRKAVAVARAIADGKLDNVIELRGHDETGQLLGALGTMQASIAQALARIRTLMDEQASSHASTIAVQHARFDAALSNMGQGLCLFDPDGRLSVANRRFGELFGIPEPGATAAQLFAGEGLAGLLGPRGAATEADFTCDLPEGQVIAVTHRVVAGGGWVATYEDVTRQREAETRLAHMAHHDALTGLPNRVLLREHMRRALARARRGAPVAVLCLDLDRFKAVNDVLGHAAGDALLRAVAVRLGDCTRETDLVARLGGDEFAIVQESVDQPANATVLARRLVETLAAPFDINGHQVVIGTSIGVVLTGEGLDEADTLLKSADLALYRAKADGRGTWRFFETEMDARMQARRLMELDLRQALPLEQLEVFYQPLVSTDGQEVSGFEALVRWHHPERGTVSPAEFIPLAEEIGLIAAIGRWVLRRACADVASWPGDLKVAVNLSPAQFRNPGLAGEVEQALSDADLEPSRLELEVTESLLMGDDAMVLATLHELRALGVRIAMDDFGTGYSSLSYLRRFPFDKIKIDQSFVRGLCEQDDCAAIVRAVVGLGRSLGMAVNAEGVETREQLAALRAEGCGEVQGYLFSKPRPGSEIPALLVRHDEAWARSGEEVGHHTASPGEALLAV